MHNLLFRGILIGTYRSTIGEGNINAYAPFIVSDEGKELGLRDSDMISIFPSKINMFTHDASVRKIVIKFEPESK